MLIALEIKIVKLYQLAIDWLDLNQSETHFYVFTTMATMDPLHNYILRARFYRASSGVFHVRNDVARLC